MFSQRLGVLSVLGVLVINGPGADPVPHGDHPGSRPNDGSQVTATTDPTGDSRSGAQDDKDVIRAEITRSGHELVLTMSLGAPLPAQSEIPAGWDLLGWVFVLDTNSNMRPAGYPFPQSAGPAPPEYVVELRRYRPGFTDPLDAKNAPAILIDRTPLLEGTVARITPVKFDIEGSVLRFRIDDAAISNLFKLEWSAGTVRARLSDADKRDITSKYWIASQTREWVGGP